MQDIYKIILYLKSLSLLVPVNLDGLITYKIRHSIDYSL